VTTRNSQTTNEQPEDLRVWPEQVMGGKFVRLLEKRLQKLRQRGDDAHGNRQLFLDDVFVAYLLAFFNPAIRSLRTIEDFSQTRQARRHLSMTKLCRSTLSDFNRLADPERLQPILDALRQEISRRDAGQKRSSDTLSQLLRQTVAVDGTWLPAVAEVAWAVQTNNQQGKRHWRARMDVQMAVESWLPELIVIPEQKQSESASAAAHVQAGRLYLYDRGYSGFDVINAHYQQHERAWQPLAEFVIRYKPAGGNAPALVDAEERPLREEDIAAGVTSDRVGRFRSSKQARHAILDVPLREVIFEYEDQGETKSLRLITNLLEVPAAIIAQLYKYRWQIELFFRWLKCFGNFDHLISHQPAGILLHFYVAVIASMLMYLHTGYRPSKYLFVLLSQVAAGAATWDEILPILRERERQRDLAQKSAAQRRAKKKAQTQ
jgi:hypothetical protein